MTVWMRVVDVRDPLGQLGQRVVGQNDELGAIVAGGGGGGGGHGAEKGDFAEIGRRFQVGEGQVLAFRPGGDRRRCRWVTMNNRFAISP